MIMSTTKIPTPFFSIVTATYNSKSTILDTAKSLQVYPSSLIEWIIIDGQSSDGTVETLTSNPYRIPDHITSEPDLGIYDAMNKGVKACKGLYVIMLNSDDYFEDNILFEIQKIIQSNSKNKIYAGGLNLISNLAAKQLFPHGRFPTSMPAFQPSSFILRELLVKFPFSLDFKIVSDYVWFKERQLDGCPIYYIPKVITNYRTSGASTNKELRLAEMKLALERILNNKIHAFVWYLTLKIRN
jgi:glycosyltransferase involved in cell wall biosynthesis